MIYKRLGRTGLEISRLGFGAMRLPKKEDGNPDPEESVRVIHRAFELGVNYIDSAVMYCNGLSQEMIGLALKGWRDKIVVSTKNHYMGADEKAWWKNLDHSLEALGVDCIDVYNIHSLTWDKWEQWVKVPGGILSWLKKARDQGLIAHICCSSHDTPENVRKIAALDEFESITLQYNLLYRDMEEAFPTIIEHDMGIVIMGPVGGGQLAAESPAFAGMVEGTRSPAELALRFVLANPHVTTAISGMNTIEQVEENCAVGGRTEPLSESEHEQVVATLGDLKGLADLYCTGCNYCMPCPSGVNIPANFRAVNVARVYGLDEAAQKQYGWMVGKAVYCTACGACEPKCPQKIPIRVQIREAAQRFDPAYGTMAFSAVPTGRDGERIIFCGALHNLSDMAAKGSVRLVSEGASVSPDQFELAIEEPFKRREFEFSVSKAVDPVPLTAEITDATGQRTERVNYRIGSCMQVESIEDLVAKTDKHPPLAIDEPEQVQTGQELLNQPFGLRAWTGYTHDALLVVARIQNKKPGGPWVLDLLTDLRCREAPPAPGFHDEMFLIRVTEGNGGTPKASSVRGAIDAARVNVISSVLSENEDSQVVEVRLAAPWAALGDRLPETGESIGFELAVTCQDKEYRPVFHASWSANKRVRRDAQAGTLLFA